MKREYDFSKAERGKFYRSDAEIKMPVYLDDQVADYLRRQAASKGVEVNEMVNDLLRRDIDLAESLK